MKPKRPASKTTSDSSGLVKFRIPEWVGLDRITPNKYNPNAMDPDKYAAFCTHVDEVGFIHPIAVAEQDDGTYVIIDGEHRWKYLKERGAKQCPIVTMPADMTGSDVASMLSSLRFNIHGTNDAIKLGEVYQAATAEGYTAETLAALNGESSDDVQKIVDLLHYEAPGSSTSSSDSGDRDEDEDDADDFVEITFSVSKQAWGPIKAEIERIIRVAGIKKHEDETIVFGQAIEMMAAVSATTPEESLA